MFRVPAVLPLAMETAADLITDAPPMVNPEAINSQAGTTSEVQHQGPKSSEETLPTTGSNTNNRLEPKTGDHHMESR